MKKKILGGVLVLLIIGLIQSYDKNIFEISEVEIQQRQKRHEYLAYELGVIYKNRIGLHYFNEIRPPWNKYLNNFSPFVDFKTYLPFI
jgi:hypothetical protein